MKHKPELTRAAEDFLKAVLEFEQAHERATTKALAGRLGVSAPTVTLMAKRLDEEGSCFGRRTGASR